MRSRVRRWRYHAWGFALIPFAPILLPTLAALVHFKARRRAWIRLWWWYGYHGVYQIDWALKRRAMRRSWPWQQCVRANYSLGPEGWVGERCIRPWHGHRSPHVMVAQRKSR